MSSGLLRKFVGVMGALALIPVVLLGAQLINISRRGIQGAVLELHTKLAESLAEKVDDYFQNSNDKLLFALSSLQRRMEWSDKQQLLQSLIETHSDIIEIAMIDGRGSEVVKVYNPDLAGEPRLSSRAGDRGYLEYRKTGKRSQTTVEHSGMPAIELYYPMNPTVSARVLISLRRLAARIESERVGGTGFAVLIDGRGRPLLFPKERFAGPAFTDFSGWPIARAAAQANSVGSSEFADSGGQEWVGAYAPAYAIGTAVVILQAKDEAYLAARQMKRAAAAAVVFVAIGSIIGAAVLARRLAQPLFALTRAAEAVARGDFNAKVDIATGDELQDLAETFNRMTGQLHSYSVLQIDRLIAEQRKTEAILFSISDGILMTDKEGRIQHANRRALEIFGLNPALSIEGKSVFEALPDSKLREAIVLAAAEPKPEAHKDVDLSTEQKHRYLRVTAHPVRTPNRGGELGVVVAVYDVTLERELDKMKEEFLHYVTHDLRNPLGSAIGFLEVLLKGTAGVLNPDQHNIVSSVKRSTSRLMAMVNNILDIAKMESGRIRLALKPVSLAGVAGRSISILESLAANKKIKVILDAGEEFTINADSDLLERVFTNLIGNAIKYTPPEGRITVSVVEDADALKCCVADTGEGIPEEYLEKIFQKFEQVTGQRRGGTGLGLTIARFFVEAHLGRIWVESQVGKGSQFYFTVPKTLALDKEGLVVLGEEARAA